MSEAEERAEPEAPAPEEPPAALTPRARAIGLGLLALFVGVYAWWPMLASLDNTQWGDGQAFHKMVEAFRVSVQRWHEVPLWDPYECGGRPLWDNPQSIGSAPLAWLSVFIGTTKTMKLWYVAHTAAGFVSMWLLCRNDLKLSRTAAFAASVAWACGGFNMHHLSGGHASFAAFEYMPLALYLWRDAEKNDASAIWLGFVVALTSTEGGALPLLYIAVLLATETFTRLWPPRRIRAVLRAGALTLAVTLGVGAVRLFPVIDQLRKHTRPLGLDLDHMTPASVLDAFVNRALGHMAHVPGHVYVWGEYGAYMGWALLVLAILGLALGGLEHAWLAGVLGVGLALMVGHQGELSPWAILNKHVYPLKEMRVPSRFGAQASMVLIVYAAIAADRLAGALGKGLAQLSAKVPAVPRLAPSTLHAMGLVIPLIAVVGAGDVLGRGLQLVHEYGAVSPPQNKKLRPSPRLWFGGPDTAALIDQPQQNRGRIQCYESWAFYEGAPLWEGDLPQVRSADPSVRIDKSARTQNTFTFDVEAPAPARVVLNSTFDYNWRTDVGTLAEQNKQLVLDVPAGTHHVRVSYWPKTFTFGAILTVVSLVLSIRALRRLSRGLRAY